MAIRKIVIAPNPILDQIAQPVVINNRETENVVADLIDTLNTQKEPEGVGIAAPQIGKSVRIFIIKDENGAINIFYNPKIIEYSKKTYRQTVTKDEDIMEGCLSIPDIYARVSRSYQITIEFDNQHGIRETRAFEGLLATYIQHEYDHLDGILFTSRALAEGNKLYKNEKNDWIEVTL